MSTAKSNYKAWLTKAENDFLNIENNLSAARVPWDTVCFHAQQAAEKVLKGFLVFHGRPLLRTHDLVALLSACVEAEPTLADLQSDCQKLSHFSVAARYPADLYEPDEKDSRQMVNAARRVQARILSCLR